MLNRTMCLSMVLLSSSLLFTVPTINAKTPFLANNVKEANIDEMVQKNDLGLIKNPIQVQFEKDKIVLEKKKAQEQRLKELELKRKQEDEQKKKEQESHREWHTFVLTYYGLLSSECGNTKGITASGRKVSRGMVASPPNLKFGTKIIIEGDEYVVEDRGSSKYIKVNNDGSIRLDVYLPRFNGESDREYHKRIQDQGVKRTQGYIIKEGE